MNAEFRRTSRLLKYINPSRCSRVVCFQASFPHSLSHQKRERKGKAAPSRLLDLTQRPTMEDVLAKAGCHARMNKLGSMMGRMKQLSIAVIGNGDNHVAVAS